MVNGPSVQVVPEPRTAFIEPEGAFRLLLQSTQVSQEYRKGLFLSLGHTDIEAQHPIQARWRLLRSPLKSPSRSDQLLLTAASV